MAPAVMNAVVLQSPGNSEEMHITTVPVPRPRPGQILVRVNAALVGSTDLKNGSPSDFADSPSVPGSDVAGEVILVGAGVTECSPGDRVLVVSESLGRTRPGGYADYVEVSATEVHPVPDNVSFISSASVGRPYSRAWTALFRDARLGMNERVAVIGAADPIGIAAIQICRWKGSSVVAVSNGRHAKRLKAIGATRVISQSAPNLADHVRAGLGRRGATVVVSVFGATLPTSLEMLDRRGRLILTGGGNPQLLDARRLVERQGHVIGSPAPADSIDFHHILKLLSESTFLPVIDSIYPLSQTGEAHRRAGSELTFGAVLVVPDDLYRSAEHVTELLEED
ncbi:MAG: quinone oxidoreductase family protein [Acidimicrobiia bacterium]